MKFAERKPAQSGSSGKVAGSRCGERRLEARRVRVDIGAVERAVCREPCEQAVEQPAIAVSTNREVKVRNVRRHGAARIDDDDAHVRPSLLRRREALVEDRMAPGEVGADEHNEIRQFQILVSSRHRVRAEGALVARDGGGHAQARVRVDIRRADKTLHQLVGDVVVLSQQLAGDVEGDRVGPVFGDRLRESRRDEIERLIPARKPAVNGRREQPAVEADRLAERGSLGAEPAEIGWVLWIAAHGDRAVGLDFSEHAAAHPAIGAGRADGLAVCAALMRSFLAGARRGGAPRERGHAPRAGSSFGTPSRARLLGIGGLDSH